MIFNKIQRLQYFSANSFYVASPSPSLPTVTIVSIPVTYTTQVEERLIKSNWSRRWRALVRPSHEVRNPKMSTVLNVSFEKLSKPLFQISHQASCFLSSDNSFKSELDISTNRCRRVMINGRSLPKSDQNSTFIMRMKIRERMSVRNDCIFVIFFS